MDDKERMDDKDLEDEKKDWDALSVHSLRNAWDKEDEVWDQIYEQLIRQENG